uniref:Uncharacterized protein n=1 Tax=Candidatus Kentrum sp. MB TaxID=2138164 RepID=A0A450XSN2_9GAMM|nr:MAG: hypothetical protein BECKMB1821G_GA0114241_11075 [Candidatus Kentron sp. MB]VFK35281.1 MAG: hypothetical protein BECKMB1821I_GA0114274_11095 [Candidatus Kentron sp. MB]VFK77180.1 MAG: hypothetical protein BECKMB1821H_GA0114242_11075 [Candidatus Kentron sp. MB]
MKQEDLNKCILAYGIPTTEDAFHRNHEHENKRYAQGFCKTGGWNRYRATVINPIQKIEPYLLKWGVRVIHDLTLDQFGGMFEDKDLSALVLVSHWLDHDDKESQIEFSDRFASVSWIIDRVPNEFEGVLDLCACHPDKLAKRLNQDRPKTIVVSTKNSELTLSFWIYFYLTLFKQMHNEKISYLQAWEDVMKELFKF